MSPTRVSKMRSFLLNASGFTLGQLLASLLIISAVFFFAAAILYPVFAPIKDRNFPAPCTSNLKQINLAMLGYIEDYDDKFPPCAISIKNDQVLFGWASSHDERGDAALSNYWIKRGATTAAQATYDQLIGNYIKHNQILHCPQAPKEYGPVSYMYNDLAAGVAQKDFAAPDKTVLVCDGENFAGNVGHAYDPNNLASAPQFSTDGTVVFGATMQTAPTRHDGGANYGYADGHVKWSKPEAIFFPSRFSESRSHKDAKTGKLLGPDPAQLNTKQSSEYVGTFYVK